MKLSMSQAGQLMQLAGMLGQSVAGPDRRQQALLAQLTEMGKGIVQNEVMRQQAKRQEKQQKTEKTSGILGTIGSIAGATVGGPVGGAIGGSLGRAAGGGDVSLGSVAMDATPSLMGMAQKSVGLTQGVTEGAADAAGLAQGAAQGATQGAKITGMVDNIAQAGLDPVATVGDALQQQAAAPLATEATQATAQAVTARAPWREWLAEQLQNVASFNRYGMGGLLGGAVQSMWGGQGGQGDQDYVEMIDEYGRPVRVRRIPWGGR